RSAHTYLDSRLAPLARTMRGRPEVAPFATPVAVLEPLAMTVSLFPIDGELPTLVDVTDPAAMLDILCSTLPDARAGRFTPTRCHVDLGHYGRQHGCVLALGPKRGIDDELVELGQALAALQRVSPGLAAEFEGWLETLRACAVASDPGEPCLSHGDFTHSQLIFSGERCGLVDFDTVCRAEPALDLAQFLAYLRMNARKAGVPASADGNGATEQL